MEKNWDNETARAWKKPNPGHKKNLERWLQYFEEVYFTLFIGDRSADKNLSDFSGGLVRARWMNLSSVYLRRSGCPYMYTGPILPPAATSAPDTCPAEASLYSWSVPVQLERPCVRGTPTPREKAALYLFRL